MDAARLVAEAERAMRGDPRPEEVIAEAWQAYELTEAVGRLLSEERDRDAAGGPPGGAAGPGEGAEHTRPVVRAGPAPVITATAAGPPRALRLTGVRDPGTALRALRDLLGTIGAALVGYVCAAEGEEAYWQFVEALDAVDEAKDRVRALGGAKAG